MKKYFKTFFSILGPLIILVSLVSDIFAACPALTTVFSDPWTKVYFSPVGNKLDYQINVNENEDENELLNNLTEEKVKNSRLVKNFITNLIHEKIKAQRQTLDKGLEVQAENGTRYLLPKGFEFYYDLPEVDGGYRVTIPDQTKVIERGGTISPKYILAQSIKAKIEIPVNFRVGLIIPKESEVQRIPEFGGIGTTLTVDPKRAPKGGYITLILENSDFDFSKARFYVCLRDRSDKNPNPFVSSDDIQLEKLEAQGSINKATIRARIPETTEISDSWRGTSVDLVVTARTEDDQRTEAFFKGFRVSSKRSAILGGIIAIFIAWVLAGVAAGKKNGSEKAREKNEVEKDKLKKVRWPIQAVSGKYGDASLSLAQILLWSILVFSASIYVFVVSGKLLDLTPEILALLGITGGTSVLAKLAATVKDEKGRDLIKEETEVIYPKLKHLVQSNGRPDLHKFQMALFTLLAAFFVAREIYTTFQFPPLPEGLLILIGISNGVYLAAKGTSKTVFEKLSEKYDELKQAEAEAQKLQEKATAAGNELKEAKKIRDDSNSSDSEKDEAKKKVETLEKKQEEANEAKRKADEKFTKIKADFDRLKTEATGTNQ